MGPKKSEKKTKPLDSDADFAKTLGNDGFDGEGTGQFSLGSGRPIQDAPGNNWSSDEDEDKVDKDENAATEPEEKLKQELINVSNIQKSDSNHNLNVSHEEQKTVQTLKDFESAQMTNSASIQGKDDPDDKRPTVILVGTKSDQFFNITNKFRELRLDRERHHKAARNKGE